MYENKYVGKVSNPHYYIFKILPISFNCLFSLSQLFVNVLFQLFFSNFFFFFEMWRVHFQIFHWWLWIERMNSFVSHFYMKVNLHIFYIFKSAWNFLIKIWNSCQSFNRIFLTHLSLWFEIYICTNCDYSLINTILQISWHDMKRRLEVKYFLIYKLGLWFNHLGHVTFSKIVFWSINFILSSYKTYYIQTLTS